MWTNWNHIGFLLPFFFTTISSFLIIMIKIRSLPSLLKTTVNTWVCAHISTITFNNKAIDLLFIGEIIFITYLPKSKKDAALLWQMKNDMFLGKKKNKIFNDLHFWDSNSISGENQLKGWNDPTYQEHCRGSVWPGELDGHFREHPIDAIDHIINVPTKQSTQQHQLRALSHTQLMKTKYLSFLEISLLKIILLTLFMGLSWISLSLIPAYFQNYMQAIIQKVIDNRKQTKALCELFWKSIILPLKKCIHLNFSPNLSASNSCHCISVLSSGGLKDSQLKLLLKCRNSQAVMSLLSLW